MSVHYEASRNRYVVRWREGGRNRSRRFPTVEEAEALDAALRRTPTTAAIAVAPFARGDGIYAYGTTAGVRFRFVFRQSDGALSSRRGFTSRRAAATARRRLVESIDRGEVTVARETFGVFWARLLQERRPYLTSGSFVDFQTHGRKRLLPALGDVPLAGMDEDRVRAWLAAMVGGDAEMLGHERRHVRLPERERVRRGARLEERDPQRPLAPRRARGRESPYIQRITDATSAPVQSTSHTTNQARGKRLVVASRSRSWAWASVLISSSVQQVVATLGVTRVA